MTTETAAVIDSAFTADLATESWEFVKFNVRGVPSVLTAVDIGDTNGLQVIEGINADGVAIDGGWEQAKLTIASGAITVPNTQSHLQFVIQPEVSATADDLSTITGGVNGQRLTLVRGKTASDADITVKDNDDNIQVRTAELQHGQPVAQVDVVTATITGATQANPVVITATNISATITGATQANPCVITASSHGLITGDTVRIASVGGMTELNGNDYVVTYINDNSFSLDDTDSSGYTLYTSGGTAVSHGMRTGQTVFIDNASDMGEINNRKFTVTLDATDPATKFSLNDEDGTGHTAWTTGGAAEVVRVKITDPHRMYSGAVVVFHDAAVMTELNGTLSRVFRLNGSYFSLDDIDAQSVTTPYTANSGRYDMLSGELEDFILTTRFDVCTLEFYDDAWRLVSASDNG